MRSVRAPRISCCRSWRSTFAARLASRHPTWWPSGLPVVGHAVSRVPPIGPDGAAVHDATPFALKMLSDPPPLVLCRAFFGFHHRHSSLAGMDIRSISPTFYAEAHGLRRTRPSSRAASSRPSRFRLWARSRGACSPVSCPMRSFSGASREPPWSSAGCCCRSGCSSCFRCG